ncbi:MAG: hypothetical protein WC246_02335 [Candidatus Paceibacterota bacterium]|jgi:hypothetical protein
MKKSKFIAYAALATLGTGILGAGVASAHGLFWNASSPEQIAANQLTAFQNEAAMLGISVDELKSEWAQGKSLIEIAQANGITKEQLQQKMKDARLAQIKTSLQALVTNGVITQAQADARLQSIQNNQATHPGRRGGMGMGMGMGL